METHTQEEKKENCIYTGSMPEAIEQNATLPGTDNEEKSDDCTNKKNHHSSAMFAASIWHNPVSQVRAHSHKAQDM